MLAYEIDIEGTIKDGYYEGDGWLDKLRADLDGLEQDLKESEDLHTFQTAVYRNSLNTVFVSEPVFQYYTDAHKFNMRLCAIIITPTINTELVRNDVDIIVMVYRRLALPEGLELGTTANLKSAEPTHYFHRVLNGKFLNIEGKGIVNVNTGFTGFSKENLPMTFNCADDYMVNGTLPEMELSKEEHIRLRSLFVTYKELRKEKNYGSSLTSDIMASPINFVLRMSFAYTIPYVLRMMKDLGLKANTSFMTMEVMDSTENIPSVKYLNKFFGGNAICIMISGTPKEEIIERLSEYDRDLNPNITLFWLVGNTDARTMYDIGIARNNKHLYRPYYYVYNEVYKGYTRKVREKMNAYCDETYGKESRNRISWAKEYYKYTRADIRKYLFDEDSIKRVVDTVMTCRINERVRVIIPELVDHISGPAMLAGQKGIGKATINAVRRDEWKTDEKAAEKRKKKNSDGRSPMERLDALVGLETVKRQVKSIVAHHHMVKKYTELGMNVDKPVYNMAFYGNPGTAKTTCAKLIGEIFYAEGIIKNANVNELTKENLVGAYVGQTSMKAKRAIKKATGGVLFLDEAYSMARSDTGGYAAEAVDELVAAMDKSKDVIYIFAGYEKEMKQFINMNPGLASRIPNNMVFKDYTDDELIDILHDMYDKQGFKVDEGVDNEVVRIVGVHRNKPNFGNARLIRNIVERSIVNHSINLDGKEDITEEEIRTITVDDMPSIEDIAGISERKRSIGFNN